MVIWPENSADLDPRDYPASAAIVDEAAQAVQAPVLVGAVPFVDDIRYNDVLIWNPETSPGRRLIRTTASTDPYLSRSTFLLVPSCASRPPR